MSFKHQALCTPMSSLLEKVTQAAARGVVLSFLDTMSAPVAVQYSTVQYTTVLCNAMQCNAIQWHKCHIYYNSRKLLNCLGRFAFSPSSVDSGAPELIVDNLSIQVHSLTNSWWILSIHEPFQYMELMTSQNSRYCTGPYSHPQK